MNYLKINIDNNQNGGYFLRMSNTKQAAPKKQQVKILGQLVTVGTKKHAILVQQVKQFNDLAAH